MKFSKSNVRITAGLIAFGVLLYSGLQHFSYIMGFLQALVALLLPFLVGAGIAFILNVPMRFLERRLFSDALIARRPLLRKLRRPVALLLTFILVLAVLFFVTFMIAPEIGRTVESLAASLPAFASRIAEQISSLVKEHPQIGEQIASLEINWQKIGEQALSLVQSGASNLLTSTIGIASSVIGAVVTAFVAMIFALYLLMQKERLSSQFTKLMRAYLPDRFTDRALEILHLADNTFSRFLSGQCLEAVILGVMFFISMSIFRFPYALAISALIAVTALIPIFGAFIGCAVGAFLICIVDPVRALWFIVLFLTLQQIEGNLIYPHVVGTSVGLPSIWVLVAVTIGGDLMGVPGMLVFIPLCSVLYALLRENVYRRLEARRTPVDAPDMQKSAPPAAEPQDGE